MTVIYTIGHSNRSLDEFLELLKKYGVVNVVDIRRFPTSRKVPHFKREVLGEALSKHGLRYHWLGDLLGGFRKGGYVRYMSTEEFAKGVDKLLDIVKTGRTVLVCRERLWFRCHRRFLSDYLVKMGYKVVHIIEGDRVYEHKYRGYV